LGLPVLDAAILHDDLIHDFSARNAPPPKEVLTVSEKLLEDHEASTSLTSHGTVSFRRFQNLHGNIFTRKGGERNGENPVVLGGEISIFPSWAGRSGGGGGLKGGGFRREAGKVCEKSIFGIARRPRGRLYDLRSALKLNPSVEGLRGLRKGEGNA